MESAQPSLGRQSRELITQPDIVDTNDFPNHGSAHDPPVAPDNRVEDQMGGGEKEIVSHETVTDLLPAPRQPQSVQDLQPTAVNLAPPSQPDIVVNHSPSAPPVVKPTEAATPVRKSVRVSRPSLKYSAGDYDLSLVWYGEEGDRE